MRVGGSFAGSGVIEDAESLMNSGLLRAFSFRPKRRSFVKLKSFE